MGNKNIPNNSQLIHGNVESDIPIPPAILLPNRKGGREYPWEILEIGQSFTSPSSRFSLTYANRRYAPKRFGAKLLSKNEIRFTRIWRLE